MSKQAREARLPIEQRPNHTMYFRGDGINCIYNLDFTPIPDESSHVGIPGYGNLIREYTITADPAQIIFDDGFQPGKDVPFLVSYTFEVEEK